MKKKIFMGISVILLLTLLLFTTPVQATDFADHSFSEDYFAIEVDLVGTGTALDPDYENPDLVRDLLDDTAVTKDSNKNEDWQFYLAYMNKSGIETAFSALEKFEHDLTFGDLLKPNVRNIIDTLGLYDEELKKTIFHINATAPFQQLVQHYDTPWGEDVFVTNNFMALIAYSADSTDRDIDISDDIYLGYTFSFQELTEAVNDVIKADPDHDEADTIGNFNYEASFEETADGFKFGINYTNVFVLWQPIKVKPKGVDIFGIEDLSRDDMGGIIFGQDIVAASVLDYLAFEYEFETNEFTGANKYVEGLVTSHYHIGETNFLVVNEPDYDSGVNWNHTPFSIAPVYEFEVPSNLKNKIVPDPRNPLTETIKIPEKVEIPLPMLSFYFDDDAKTRMRMENGFGISVMTATTTFGVSVIDPDTSALTHNPDDINLMMGGNTYFSTIFQGKKEYKLHGLETLWPDIPTEHNASIIPIVLDDWSDWDVEGVGVGYFAVEFGMAYGFTRFMAEQLSPDLVTMV
ncbi:hypothetical protein KAR91_84390, partial [Candidatus Pacearchaeota archaeon]|nr:hypothetical protein [Candidatus Pacearchaeota archaeon]